MRKLTKLMLMVATPLACGMGIMVGCQKLHDAGAVLAEGLGGEKGKQMFEGGSQIVDAANITQEKAGMIGRATAIELTNQYSVSQNQALELYVNMIGYTLGMVSDHPSNHYLFGVLDSDSVGAFSAPDGYVFITKGAIMRAQNEAEIAGLLAHEMTHVLAGHGINSVQLQMGIAGGIKILGSTTDITQFTSLMDTGIKSLTNEVHNQPQELAADAGAIKLLVAAGYDPNSFVDYLKRIQTEQAANPGGGIMSTHPATADRIAEAQKAIAASGSSGGQMLVDRFQKILALSAAPVPAVPVPTPVPTTPTAPPASPNVNDLMKG